MVGRKVKAFLCACGLVAAGLAAPCYALAGAAALGADAERSVSFFFSDEAWGGVPFSEADKQRAMAEAMLGGEPVRLETSVVHLLSAPEVRVRDFVAVFEVDGSVRPPTVRAGYELELLVPHSQGAMTVELVNAETGVVNIVKLGPED